MLVYVNYAHAKNYAFSFYFCNYVTSANYAAVLFFGKWVKLMLLLTIYAKHYASTIQPNQSLIACWSTLRIITPTSCTVGIKSVAFS